MIRIRPYKDSDETAILSWGADEETFYNWTAGVLGEYPIDSAKFHKTAENMRFTALDETEPAGFFIVRNPNHTLEELRFGFVIVDPAKRGRGIGKAMLQQGLDYAFRLYRAERVTLGVFEDNAPARRCYRAAGFSDTEVHHSYRIHGRERCTIEMECLRDEFMKTGIRTDRMPEKMESSDVRSGRTLEGMRTSERTLSAVEAFAESGATEEEAERLDALCERARKYITDLFGAGSGGHGVDHALRVYQNAMTIAAEEPSCDLFTVRLAALLHDADDHKLFQTVNNANARSFLRENHIEETRIDRICEVINSVSFSQNRGQRPSTPEGCIVQDADRLDAMGAIGIARTFAYGGEHGRSLQASVQHFHDKLLQLKDLMNTETGKKLAQTRHAYLEDFLEELKTECFT